MQYHEIKLISPYFFSLVITFASVVFDAGATAFGVVAATGAASVVFSVVAAAGVDAPASGASSSASVIIDLPVEESVFISTGGLDGVDKEPPIYIQLYNHFHRNSIITFIIQYFKIFYFIVINIFISAANFNSWKRMQFILHKQLSI